MRRLRLFLGLLVLGGAATIGHRAGAQQRSDRSGPDGVAPSASTKAVEDELIRLVKAQWAAEAQKNNADALRNTAPEYTEFNADYATRLEGRDLRARLNEADFKASGRNLAQEMVNPKVQVYGNVAVLSYNYVGVTQNKDGVNQPARAKSTRVYVKQGNTWMLVHANFAFDPPPPAPQ